MKYILLLLCVLNFGCKNANEDKLAETTTLYFIRHAEKNRENPDEENPALTKKGLERAEKWSEILKNVPFDAVYSTNYTRTKQTATPTASKNGLSITTYPPENLDIEKIYTQGLHHVLVVGHSNTVPKLVNKLIGKETYTDIEDTNNGNLYIVTLEGKTVVSVNLLTIN
ncbi:phosphoglycerate mutase family protein [Galbibacter sp. PAP.153]|uniref:SixA phosphatase family protein n=1 Tax=Galbibacter sp. PAP.153 TaxID=3104623 RepID=UPI0030085F64